KDRSKKLQNALDRIKSLEKIKDQANEEKKMAPPILGNEISRGTSLSDDAVTSMQASYFDQVRDHLQNNWELPVWLARQNLSAQVMVTLDGRGMIRSVRFVKPSGNPQFDETVRRTLRASQPLPIPPSEVKTSVLLDGILIGFPL
ncbi:MAG: energy transducer TonB, partial [Bdellovibrionota bacterium]